MKNVDIILNTPLHLVAADQNLVSKNAYEQIVKISAKIIQETQFALEIEIEQCYSDKSSKLNCPFKKISLPHHKIDYVVLK